MREASTAVMRQLADSGGRLPAPRKQLAAQGFARLTGLSDGGGDNEKGSVHEQG